MTALCACRPTSAVTTALYWRSGFAGHDVVAIIEDSRGALDREVFARSAASTNSASLTEGHERQFFLAPALLCLPTAARGSSGNVVAERPGGEGKGTLVLRAVRSAPCRALSSTRGQSALSASARHQRWEQAPGPIASRRQARRDRANRTGPVLRAWKAVHREPGRTASFAGVPLPRFGTARRSLPRGTPARGLLPKAETGAGTCARDHGDCRAPEAPP
jgi:hypothetical protein